MTAIGPATAGGGTLRGERVFYRFWCGRLASVFAYQMLSVAVGWQVYALTGSALDLGLIGLAQFLPSIALLLVVGHVADHFDRRRVVQLCQWIEALALLVIGWATLAGHVTRDMLFALVIVIGAARAFEFPTVQAMLAATVPAAKLPRAVAISSTAGQLGIVLGPALGGLVYAFGAVYVYAVCATLFVVASVLLGPGLALLRPPLAGEPTSRSLFAGIQFIRSKPALLGAISLDLFAVLLGGAAALLPIYARDILLTGPWGLGLLRSAPAVGALAVALWLARHPLRRREGRAMFAGVMGFGVATIVFGLSTSLSLSLAMLVAMGAADMLSVVVRQSLFQLNTPDAMRGRVGAVNAIFIGASNQLGEFESGVTAAWLGARNAVVVGGVGTLLVALAWTRLFPALRDVDGMRVNGLRN
ncbi:MAG: MFS transporter [Proteobacteria bacterium]|nr:MFS transporter [Pseudomonadota bacterium]